MVFETVIDLVGHAAASTLGFIIGDIPGAFAADSLYSALAHGNSSQKMPIRKKSIVVARPNPGRSMPPPSQRRRLMGKTNTKRIKPRPMKKRAVKKCRPMTTCLKKQVTRIAKKIHLGGIANAVYNKTLLCAFPEVLGAPDTPLQMVTNICYFRGNLITDASFVVASYEKVIDAVSILFGNKTAAVPYTATGNISDDHLVVPNYREFSQYEFFNNTPADQAFLIYECTPREDTDQTISDAYNDMTNSEVGGYGSRGKGYFGIRPEQYQQFKQKYRILKKKQVVLKPGHRGMYYLNSYETYIKFDQWFKKGTTIPTKFRKGVTKELLIINWNMAAYGSPTGADAFQGAAWTLVQGSTLATPSYGNGVGVQFTSRISMECPEKLASTVDRDNIICNLALGASNLGVTAPNTIVTPSYVAPVMIQ